MEYGIRNTEYDRLRSQRLKLPGGAATHSLFHIPDSRFPNGFTLIELVIAVGILVMVWATISVAFIALRQSNDLSRASDGFVSLVRLARERTIAAESDTRWGVHVAATRADLFRGSSYSGTSEDAFSFPSSVTASWGFTGGGDDIVFDFLDGTTAEDGTVTFTRTDGATRMVLVYASGELAVSHTLPPPVGTRVTDTRHVHFALPYSLNNAMTMTLRFADPPSEDVLQQITIPSQISGGKFLWEGDVSVYGANQHLRIVSHSMDASSTNLSVTRDRMQNTKAVTIDVDGSVVGSYAVSGTVTPGVGVTAAVQ